MAMTHLEKQLNLPVIFTSSWRFTNIPSQRWLHLKIVIPGTTLKCHPRLSRKVSLIKNSFPKLRSALLNKALQLKCRPYCNFFGSRFQIKMLLPKIMSSVRGPPSHPLTIVTTLHSRNMGILPITYHMYYCLW